MAMNRNMTMAEKEIREYTQERMNRSERTGISFPEDVKEQIQNYASMTGDEYRINRMIRRLSEAVQASDEQKVQELLQSARAEVQAFPDTTIGMAALRGYGYTDTDLYPLRKDVALELHRMGEKIFCLHPDGTKGEYASREMILKHEGIFGIEKTAWQRIQEQENEMDVYDYTYEPMSVIDKEDALKMYDAGETVYRITSYRNPLAVTERMEIERGGDHFQMEKAALERMKTLEERMQAYPGISSLKEAKLLLGDQDMYGIYQIDDDTAGREYKFMNLSFIERYGYQVHKEDYQLVYSDRLWQGETLDSLYERFNIAHPEDYTGHSLSVSDMIVLNEGGNVKAYFVDSISFRELPDFLQLEQKLDMRDKQEQEKAGKEYKPLAKIEEIEEANYNMIDNVLNNMPPKKEPYLEYYAAECDEFHNLGKIYVSTNLEEILAKYREIIEDPSLSYYGNGMGFIYHDPTEPHYDGAEITIISGTSIRGDNLDHVAFMAAMPMAYEALDKIRETFSEFPYYPPKNIKEQLYPENMTADELAAALSKLAADFDYYDYQDRFGSEEDLELVAAEIRCGNAHQYFPYMKDIVDEECGESLQAEVLLERMKSYKQEMPEGMEPIVWVNYCEDSELVGKGHHKLGELDKVVSAMDAELSAKIDAKTGEPEKTIQTYLTIYYPDQEQMKKMQAKISIGDGDGGIVRQLKAQNEMKLTDESWLDYQKTKGEEVFTSYMADLTDMQEHVLPYLQSFCSLEEKTPEKEVMEVKKEGKAEISLPEKPKSIHERLKINKELVAKQQGKDKKEKGVELE